MTKAKKSAPKPEKTEAQKRQGTSRKYHERVARGQPNVTLSMAAETKALLDALSKRLVRSRSSIVDEALKDFAKKNR